MGDIGEMIMISCVACKHWRFDEGEPDYSELTPGTEWNSSCEKGHWDVGGAYTSREKFRSCLLQAEKCNDFEILDDLK